MRIGIDCRMYSSRFTGIGRYVYELTENLFRIDRENEYVLFFNQPEFEKFSSPNARVTKVLVNSPHYSVREQTLFLYHVRKTKLDLMHFTHFNAPLLYFGSSVVTIHDLTLSFFHGKKMTSLIHRLGYQLVIRNIIKKAKKSFPFLKIQRTIFKKSFTSMLKKFKPPTSESTRISIQYRKKNWSSNFNR